MKLVGETGLTEWGLSTLQALEGASEEQRREIGVRACSEAVHDAELLGQVQLSLFEKLEIIHRHELWRFHFIGDGDVERSCESMEEFIRDAVAPRVQHNRQTMYRMQEALGEAARLREAYGTCKSSWTVLGHLAAETRRQAQGKGVLLPAEHEELSAAAAAGTLAKRDVEARLTGSSAPTEPAKVQLTVVPGELSEEAARLVRMMRRTTSATHLLAKSLDEIEFRTVDSWHGMSYQDLSELHAALAKLEAYHPDRVAACRRVVDAELVFRQHAKRSVSAS